MDDRFDGMIRHLRDAIAESMMHSEKVTGLLRELAHDGVHVAVEVSGPVQPADQEPNKCADQAGGQWTAQDRELLKEMGIQPG